MEEAKTCTSCASRSARNSHAINMRSPRMCILMLNCENPNIGVHMVSRLLWVQFRKLIAVHSGAEEDRLLSSPSIRSHEMHPDRVCACQLY